tara:strand:+ start:290 stop:1348 length:1059 start_codon:yes stop_codon:yes gene_type:complete
MAKGLNSSIINAIFDLEPTALLEFYILYYDYQSDSQEQLHFHGGSNGIAGKIIFNGQEYLPLPIEGEAFEVLGDQRLPRPKLRISNAGFYVSSLLRRYDNLNGAKLVRRRTFAKFLDDENFDNNVNPWGAANPNARLPDEKYFISRVAAENKLLVEFELVSSLELENINIPARKISSRYCTWIYRGFGCRYGSDTTAIGDGLDRPIANSNDNLFVTGSGVNFELNSGIFSIQKTGSTVNDVLNPSGIWQTGSHTYDVGDYVFRVSDKVLKGQELTANFYANHSVYYVCKSGHTPTSDSFKPEKRSDLWVKDVCSKKLGGCFLRFQNEDYDDGINNGKTLPYGGFPGTERFSY